MCYTVCRLHNCRLVKAASQLDSCCLYVVYGRKKSFHISSQSVKTVSKHTCTPSEVKDLPRNSSCEIIPGIMLSIRCYRRIRASCGGASILSLIFLRFIVLLGSVRSAYILLCSFFPELVVCFFLQPSTFYTQTLPRLSSCSMK